MYRFKIPHKNLDTQKKTHKIIHAESTKEARNIAMEQCKGTNLTVVGGVRHIVNLGRVSG